jgi:GINS complex subunit 4
MFYSTPAFHCVSNWRAFEVLKYNASMDVNALCTAVANEKLSPDILPYEEELVAEAIERIKAQVQTFFFLGFFVSFFTSTIFFLSLQEKTLEQMTRKGEEVLVINICRMDLDRVLFLLRTYLRTRVLKVKFH